MLAMIGVPSHRAASAAVTARRAWEYGRSHWDSRTIGASGSSGGTVHTITARNATAPTPLMCVGSHRSANAESTVSATTIDTM